jgi:hypothetical protein
MASSSHATIAAQQFPRAFSSLVIPPQPVSSASLFIRQTDAGSSTAAQDLYGLGVRVGLYLQALGMILYNYGDQKNYGKGLKLASGSITISILVSWFVFASNQLFSPSEAFIVLLILMNLSFPAKTTLLNPETVIGETVGLIVLLATELGTCSALLWTFARLSETLPTLQTENMVFFFAEVSITGWFRYLALVYCVWDTVTSISFAYKVIRVIGVSWDCYKDGQTEATPEGKDKIRKIMRWDEMQKIIRCLHWLVWILVVLAVELTVKWNHLSPTTNLQSPGQLIPFISGIIILVDSVFVAGRQVAPPYAKHLFGLITISIDSVVSGCDQVRHFSAKTLSGFAKSMRRSSKNIFTNKRRRENAIHLNPVGPGEPGETGAER